MEKIRQKRSKITGIADQKSGQSFFSTERILRGGNRHVEKHRSLPKLASDSSSCSSDSTNEDPIPLELGSRSSRHAFGNPIKSLLAEEMTRESESNRRSPNVVARLMGLDVLPPHQTTSKQRKWQSENSSKRTTSGERAHKNGMFCDGQSSRRRSKYQQEFKDVFEVTETLKMKSSNCSPQGTARLKLTEIEMELIRQKFIDAKRLSTLEKLQNSKEFHDALEVLSSNKDLLLELLQQPDSLFTEHLLNLQSPLSHSNSGNLEATKSSGCQKYDNQYFGWNSERGTPRKNYSKSPRNHSDAFSNHSDSNNPHRSSFKISKSQLHGKDKLADQPTRIIVLKPNVGKAQNSTGSIYPQCSSPAFHSDVGDHREIEAGLWQKKNFPDYVGLSRHKSRQSREIAKEITRQMRHSFNNGSTNLSPVPFHGYAVDTCSSEISAREPANRDKCSSSSRSKESSVTREAKKRLSERWHLTHESQDMGPVRKSSTLGEMLSQPEKEAIPARLDLRIGDDRFVEKLSNDYEPVELVEPLGISSRDGWRNEFMGKLSKSPSASLSSYGSSETRQVTGSLHTDSYRIPKYVLKREKISAGKVKVDQRENLSQKNLGSSNKKSYSSHCKFRERNSTMENPVNQNQGKTDYSQDYTFEKNIMIDEGCPRIVNVETPEVSIPVSARGDSCYGGQDTSTPEESSGLPYQDRSITLHDAIARLESPSSSKEADQPSPVSVLEPPFMDNLSSRTECFESLNADLNGLRMQLWLLKSESEIYDEGPMLVSSDEDLVEESVNFSNKKQLHSKPEASREFSYILDVLSYSGLQATDPETFASSWHSPECPIDPIIFNELEEKHTDGISQPRSETKLLFDRINSGILELYKQYTGPLPWVGPTTGCHKWRKDELHNDLHKLLALQEKKLTEDSIEKVLVREWKWLDLGEDIDQIGRDIEKLLIDELIAEV